MTVSKLKKLQTQTVEFKLKQRDHDNIRLINEALDDDRDLSQLRKLAAVRGLVNHQLRQACWQRLAGAPGGDFDSGAYEQLACKQHRDSTTVKCDVERSLWAFTKGMSEDERAAKRAQLSRLLNAVVNRHPGDVHYYQGLHDVASVLLLVLGEAPAYHVLSHLATCHLRDCTRQTLDPVMELLQLLYPIIGAADPEVYRALTASGLPPFFALSWFLTWFSHTTKELADAARLFDLFLSSHPLMPLYVGAAAVLSHRAEILACDGDMPELHHLLSNLDVSAHSTIDELACAAIRLYKQAQPRVLARQHGMRWALCAAPDAVLDGSSWRVPQKDISSAQLEAARGGRKGGGGSAAATAGGGGFTDSWLAGTPGGQAATLAARMSGLLLAARGRAGSRGRLALASTLVSLTGLASAYLVAAWLALESGMAGRSAGS